MNSPSKAIEDLTTGTVVLRGGFFTKLHLLGNIRDAHELERRIGYEPGRLRHGWFLLHLQRIPTEHEFEFAGYSYFSGGRVAGHHLDPSKRGTTPEEELLTMKVDIPTLKRKTIQNFRVIGPERLVKVVPREIDTSVTHEDSIQKGKYWNLNLEPIAQWRLTLRVPFLVHTFYP